MNPFWEGVVAGYGIAIPVGAIAILILDTGMQRGFRQGFLAGAGAATADLLFALLAALAGSVLALLLAPYASTLQLASGLLLVGLGGYGLLRMRVAKTTTEALAVEVSGRRTYAQFLALTLLNPMTIAYFAALILGQNAGTIVAVADRVAFVVGAGLASLSW